MPVPVVSFCLNHKTLNYEIQGSYFVTWQPSAEKVIINIEYHQPISFFYWYIQWFNIWFVWHLVFSNLRCVITPSKGIRILESGKLFFACGIWNPGPWNLEYSSRNLDLTNNWNPESNSTDTDSGIKNLESGIHSMGSRISKCRGFPNIGHIVDKTWQFLAIVVSSFMMTATLNLLCLLCFC